MITGYNTDVRHGEVVFHVQTEDKGTANPYIESLVYVGGQVLASKRASYAELLAEGKDEKDIVALMDHQHRTMIAAIRHGKLDAKLAALTSGRQTGQFPAVETPVSRPVQVVSPPPPTTPVAVQTPPPSRVDSGATVSRPAPPPTRPTPMPERTLDQVILEYLTNEADQEQLVLLLNEDANLALGQRADLVLRTSSSKSGNPVPGAQISIRMISTVAEPRVLAAGRTDDRGLLPLAFDIPQVGRGTSALIITAASAIGRAELKHLL
ncbi:MAG TPA: hypothetical protein VJ725_19150 [Thermoanaerobaculia bacterium]|nr:hypothetical protein [Thermoanaerobaculia bacterium]